MVDFRKGWVQHATICIFSSEAIKCGIRALEERSCSITYSAERSSTVRSPKDKKDLDLPTERKGGVTEVRVRC